MVVDQVFQLILIASHHLFELLVEDLQHLVWLLPTVLILLQELESALDVIRGLLRYAES